jgi:hypothetical protein
MFRDSLSGKDLKCERVYKTHVHSNSPGASAFIPILISALVILLLLRIYWRIVSNDSVSDSGETFSMAYDLRFCIPNSNFTVDIFFFWSRS